jgi:uncharacterized repeat protein (TIGR01451 family)
MLNKRFGIRWLAWPAIAAIVVLIGLSVSSTPVAQGNGGEDKMELLPATQVVGLGNPFTVNIKATTDEADFQGYEDAIYYPYPEVTTSAITQLQPASMTTCGTMAITEPDPAYGSGTDTGSAYDYGCSAGAPVGTFTGNVTKFDMACGQTSGTYTLHIITMIDDPTYGSTLLNSAGAPITTTYYDATVTCKPVSDLEITKTHTPEPMTVGLPGTYTITVHNIGPAAAKGVVIVDEVPLDKEVQGLVEDMGAYYLMPPAGGMDVTGDTIPDAPCLWFAMFPNPMPPYTPPLLNNVVLCYAAGAGMPPMPPLASLAPSQTVTLIIPVIPTVAGLVTNVATVVTFGPFLPYIPETDPTLDPNPLNNQALDPTTEVPPVILEGYDKGASAEPGTLWVAPGVDHAISTVSEVIYVVEGGPNPNIVHTWTATPSNDSLQLAWQPEPWSDPGDPSVTTWTSTGHTDGEEFTTTMPLWVRCTGDGGGTVDIDMEMIAGNQPEDSSTSLKVNCETGQIVKVPSGAVNLWICKGPDCSDKNGPIDGLGQLTIDEVVSGIAGTAGAFEFDVSFDTAIWGATGVVVTPTDWLGPGADCSMTIVRENDIRVACANGSGSTVSLPTTIATIALTPNPDLVGQMILTPGQQNGLFTTISDSGCEVADTLGDPIAGSLQSGLMGGCNSVAITVRVLEGDLNLDCAVNVLDDQAIAYRYGASFGMLLYTPWYDLEPALKDRDIDIKDVQKVFGRNGSTCAAPYPDQDPILPVDP